MAHLRAPLRLASRSLIGEVRINEPLPDNDIVLANAQLSFPEAYPGTTSRTAPVWVVNTSTSPVAVTSATVTGANSGDYTIDSSGCATSLDPGQTCPISVTFLPAAAGPSTASLDLVDTSTVGVHSATLSGAGITGSSAFHVRGQVGGDNNGNGSTGNGHALSLDLTPQVSGFTITGAESSSASGVALTVATATHTLSASFYPSAGDALTPGTTYVGAAKSTTRGTGVGLYFTADGSSCSMVSGQFTVVEAAFDASGSLEKFAAYFQQTCDQGDPVYGWLSYRADNPLQPFAGDGPTDLTASAPGGAARGASVTVLGVLRSMGLGLPGKALSVTRSTLLGRTGLTPVTTDAHGAYSFKDLPPVGGPVTYEVTWVGDAHNPASSAETAVLVARLPTLVSIRASAATVAYGGYVTMTATLGRTVRGRSIEIWVVDMGATPLRYSLVRRAVVSRAGTYAFRYRLYRNQLFQVRFPGDAYNAPASARYTVSSTAYVSTALVGSYGAAGGYRLYASSVQPEIHGVILPRRRNVGCVRFQGQYLSNGVWAALTMSSCQPVMSSGFAQVFLIAKSGMHPVGVPMRFRSLLARDYINAASVSGWSYLKFTN